MLLKNSLVARDQQQRSILAERWLRLPGEVRVQVRGLCLQILADPEKSVRSTAALVVAKIAGIEIPVDLWDELIPALVQNITGGSAHLRQASFETLGYVCEEVPDRLQDKSSLILNAISTGMKSDEQNDDIKFAATTALKNALDFVRANMNNPNERGLIMQMIFTSTQSANAHVRVAAFQCLVEVASLYYELLASFINDIYLLTSKAIQVEEDEVAQQAIEFWSTVCDEEMELMEENREALEKQRKPKRQCQNFAQIALPNITPLILMRLTNQSEEVDDDTWNGAMAAGVCLGLLAQTCGDNIVMLVLPFVQEHIVNPNWRFREAATLSFGCILEGPTRGKLAPLVAQALPVIVSHMKDESDLVKDTTAWTIGRICHLLPECIDQKVALPALMQALLGGLSDVPRVASNVCWAIHNLAENIEVGAGEQTSALSPYFEGLIRALLQTTERPDAEGNLLTSAYEAINVLIHTAAPDMYPLIGQLLPTVMARLQHTLMQTTHSAEEQNEVQALLCGALQVIIQKLNDEIVRPHTENLMTLFLQVLQSKDATVHEEAMMAIGSIANRVGQDFQRFMPHFQPFLLIGLSNAAAYHVCTVSVGVVGDLSRALETAFIPCCDDIMSRLLQNLQDPNMERSVKPHIISCLGDIALAVSGYFERYMPFVLPFLVQASQIQLDPADSDNQEYLTNLRESVLEAFTGILQGLSADKKMHLFLPCVEPVIKFLDLLAKPSEEREDQVLKAAVGVIGDIASHLGQIPQVREQLQGRPSINFLLTAAKNSDSPVIKEAGDWARDQVKDALKSSG